VSATYYHASLLEQERNRRHKLWMKGRVHVMVATVAFGIGAPPSPALAAGDRQTSSHQTTHNLGLVTGIDKPNVRFVIHTTIPKSIEEYYQVGAPAHQVLAPSSACLTFHGV
jgi:superfamily II DNA helicase RecQ